MALEDYNICPTHGVVAPERIMIGGPTGGVATCFLDTEEGTCGCLLKSKSQVDAEMAGVRAMVGGIIEEVYGDTGQ